MILQVLLVQYVVDEPGEAFPVVFRLRVRQCQVPVEVIVLFCQLVIFFVVEALANTTGTVPEAHLALGVQTLELVEDMTAHGRHARTTTDKDHLGVGVLGEEFTEGPEHSDLVTRLQVEHERAHDTRRNILGPRRRGGNPDVELENALLFRVVRHGVSTDHFFVVLAVQIEEVETLPITPVFLCDIKIREIDIERRRFQLYITTSPEIHVLAFRQLQGQFLDESGHVVIGDNFAFPLFHTEEFFRHLNLHVLLHVDLAAQTPAIANFTLGEVAFFGGQNVTPAVDHLTLALRTGTAAATGRRQEDSLVCQGAQQLAASRSIDAFFCITIDIDMYITGSHQTRAGSKNHRHQRQHDGGEHDDTENNLNTHDSTPPLQLHAGK